MCEFWLAPIQDQRLPASERMPEQAREPRVPPLGQSRRDTRGCFFARVVINGKVGGIEHLEVEIDVLDFIPAELLRTGVAAAGPYEKGEKRHSAQH